MCASYARHLFTVIFQLVLTTHSPEHMVPHFLKGNSFYFLKTVFTCLSPTNHSLRFHSMRNMELQQLQVLFPKHLEIPLLTV